MDDYTAHRQNEQCFISYLIIMKKLPLLIAFVFVMAIILQWCTSNLTPEKVAEINENSQTTENHQTVISSQSTTTNITQTKWAIYSSAELFTDRDLEQTPDLTNAKYYTVSDGEDITITEEWVYVLKWTANNVTVFVEAWDQDKVQIVLDGVSISNTDSPCIYVKQADKVFVTTTDSENTLEVTDEFVDDGETNTNGVIFSKDDITLNGVGTLAINSTKNWIVWKDDLKITGGTYNITASKKAIDANDSIRIMDGTFVLNAQTDWLHAENSDDDSVGYIYIWWWDFTINAWDDAIHATSIVQIDDWNFVINWAEWIEWTYIQINWWNIDITASDDGINAAHKSDSYEIALIFNGWYTKITMWAWDTDWIDSNGNLYIYGWTIDISARSPADYDWTVVYEWGKLIIDWEEYTYVPNQMMGWSRWWMGGWMWPRWWDMPQWMWSWEMRWMPNWEMPNPEMKGGRWHWNWNPQENQTNN